MGSYHIGRHPCAATQSIGLTCTSDNRGAMWLFVLALLVTAVAPGQTIVNPSRIPEPLRRLSADREGEQTLKCSVTPIKPRLDYGFHFQAGYLMTVPLRQYVGSGHVWAVIIKITPEGSDHNPVYFATRVQLPSIPETKLDAELGGGYLMGVGKYRVEWSLIDNKSRVCRKDWDVEAKLGRGEREVQVALPPNTLADLSLRGTRKAEIAKADMRPLRLTVLLHAAPMSPRRTRLRPGDTLTLLGAFSSLLERLPTKSVKLVVFNLDQQAEIYREESFTRDSFDRVAGAMNRLELGSVDIGILQNRHGHLDLLADLMNQELTAKEPSDVVLFLGPASRYWDNLPRDEIQHARAGSPRFFYFRFQPSFRRTAAFPDSIQMAIGRLKGKTSLIHTPGELAKAIEQLETRVAEQR